ncbi:hypothetical protein VTN77DRAFT_7661 [Rasamsonia byssochlamydoides]|uniref:uncharacterized protein n=1 Tax=Rasamsonia byssochlamydoides TaxID=89139 RepID=UPI003743CD3B
MNAGERTAAVSGDAADQRQGESSGNKQEEFRDPCEKQEQVSLLRKEADDTTTGKNGDNRKSLTTQDVRQDGVQAEDQDTITFRANHRGRQGYLELSSQGLRFVVKNNRHSLSSLNPKKNNNHHRSREELWSYPFSSLVQMTKRHSPMLSKVAGADSSLKRLELEVLIPEDDNNTGGDNLIRPDPSEAEGKGEDDPYTYAGKKGMTTRLETLDVDGGERDEIFNLIVGWSKARWQVLGSKSEAKKIMDKKERRERRSTE